MYRTNVPWTIVLDHCTDPAQPKTANDVNIAAVIKFGFGVQKLDESIFDKEDQKPVSWRHTLGVKSPK
jgi:hypothetical protein